MKKFTKYVQPNNLGTENQKLTVYKDQVLVFYPNYLAEYVFCYTQADLIYDIFLLFILLILVSFFYTQNLQLLFTTMLY